MKETTYKQTEVGMIPSDWEVKKLGDALKVIGGGAFKSIDASQAGVKWLKIANVGINQAVWNDESYLPSALIKDNENFLLKEGDYVIALTRPILDRKLKIAKLNKNDVPALLNQRVGKIEVECQTDIDFAYYLFQKFEIINGLLQSMAGTDPPNLSNKGIYSIDCAFPPTKAEQTTIATALSDADALITSLTTLIAKKRMIKQGAMQQLLQPKEGWEVKKLGEICENIGSGKSKTQSEGGKFPIFGSTGIIGWCNAYDYYGHKILVARVGANAGTVNFVYGNYCVSDNTLIVSLKPEIDLNFIYSFLILFQLNKLVFGSGQPLITGGQLKNIEISLPKTKEEQTRIATILSDMDEEIAALETKLEKYRKVKLGMMQNLLTGKIRLV